MDQHIFFLDRHISSLDRYNIGGKSKFSLSALLKSLQELSGVENKVTQFLAILLNTPVGKSELPHFIFQLGFVSIIVPLTVLCCEKFFESTHFTNEDAFQLLIFNVVLLIYTVLFYVSWYNYQQSSPLDFSSLSSCYKMEQFINSCLCRFCNIVLVQGAFILNDKCNDAYFLNYISVLISYLLVQPCTGDKYIPFLDLRSKSILKMNCVVGCSSVGFYMVLSLLFLAGFLLKSIL